MDPPLPLPRPPASPLLLAAPAPGPPPPQKAGEGGCCSAALCGPDQRTRAPQRRPNSGRAATHSRTCSAAKCHCRFCGAGAGDAPPRRQMTPIPPDGSDGHGGSRCPELFLSCPDFWSLRPGARTCGPPSSQPLWKLTDFINLEENFPARSRRRGLFCIHAKGKLKKSHVYIFTGPRDLPRGLHKSRSD